MEFSEDIKDILKTRFNNADIYNMSVQELKAFKEEVTQLRQEYFLLEICMKQLGNAAYGAAANKFFYFYNLPLAGDITGESRILTKTMWHNLEEWFHEKIWERKDLWKQFDFELDESKHDWYRQQPVSIYSDTDSVYTTYGTFFECMTPKYQEKYKEDRAKLDWILKYNQDFQDKLNTQWCEEIFNPRHGKSIHNFELETVSRAGIYLKKKKYLKGLVFSKGKYFDHPKPTGTGIEIIKSTTPQLCRKILTDLMEDLMFNYGTMSKSDYLIYFNNKLAQYKKEFYRAPVEDISQSVGIGNYKKYVINDEDSLEFALKAPISVKGIARFNYLAHKNGQDNLKTYSGKIKYYRIRVGKKKDDVEMFGFPAGELPSWAPPMDKLSQWDKTIIEPINRFLEVMKIPLAQASDTVQLDMFSQLGMD